MVTVHLFEWYQQSNLQFMVIFGMYLWKIAIVLQQELLGNVFGAQNDHLSENCNVLTFNK